MLPLLIFISLGIWFKASNTPGTVPFKKTKETKEADLLKNELTVLAKQLKKVTVLSFSQELDEGWGRNPFYYGEEFKTNNALAQDKAVDSDPVLNGIFWDDQNPSAVINNRYVAVNDTFGEYTVMAIRKNVVVLSDGMDHIELRTGLY